MNNISLHYQLLIDFVTNNNNNAIGNYNILYNYAFTYFNKWSEVRRVIFLGKLKNDITVYKLTSTSSQKKKYIFIDQHLASSRSNKRKYKK